MPELTLSKAIEEIAGPGHKPANPHPAPKKNRTDNQFFIYFFIG